MWYTYARVYDRTTNENEKLTSVEAERCFRSLKLFLFYFQCVYLRNCELSSLEYICSKKNPSYCVGAIQQITEHMCFSLAEESYFLPPNNIIAELFGRLVFFLQASILVSEIIIFHYFILFRLCLISINERHTKKQMFAF